MLVLSLSLSSSSSFLLNRFCVNTASSRGGVYLARSRASSRSNSNSFHNVIVRRGISGISGNSRTIAYVAGKAMSSDKNLDWTETDHAALSKGQTKLQEALDKSLQVFESSTRETVQLTDILYRMSEDLKTNNEFFSLAPLAQINCGPYRKRPDTNAKDSERHQQTVKRADGFLLTPEKVVEVCIDVAKHSKSTFYLVFEKGWDVMSDKRIVISTKTVKDNIDFAPFKGADAYLLQTEKRGAGRTLDDSVFGLVNDLEGIGLNVPMEYKLTQKLIKQTLEDMQPKGFGYENKLGYIPNLVPTNKSGRFSSLVTLQEDCTKSTVLVVAGESGSGKSIYAQRDAIPDGSSVLYMSLLQKDLPPLIEDDVHFDAWKKLIRVLFLKTQKRDASYPDSSGLVDLARANIRCVSEVLNKDPSGWALQVFDNALQNVKSKENILKAWLEAYDPPKLEKLVIVIDEAGRDLRFADGIITMARSLLRDYLKYANQLALIICGSGLDTLKLNPYEDDMRFLGSDPSLSETVIMKTPDLNKISGAKGWPSKDAIEGGKISRVLATNAHLLTHVVYKVLSSDIVTYGVEGQDLLEKQVAFGSFPAAMDYSVHKYGSMNGLKGLSYEGKDLLFLNAFRYMHYQKTNGRDVMEGHHSRFCTGMEFVQFVPDANEETREDAGQSSKEMDKRYENASNQKKPTSGQSQLLQMGVVRQRFDDTSLALKYMACKGRALQLISEDRSSFENVIASHIFRMMQSRLTGYKTSVQPVEMYTLKNAWPTALSDSIKGNKTKIEERIAKFKSYPDVEKDINNLRQLFAAKNGADHAIVLRQSNACAQGFDVGVILREDGKYVLLVFQCTNWNISKASDASTSFKESLSSLGLVWNHKTSSTEVATDESDESDGSAYYSNECTDHLIESVSDVGRENFAIKRFVCLSSDEVGELCLQDENVEVWKLSMFEPTVSALNSILVD